MKYRLVRFLSLFFLNLALVAACSGTAKVTSRLEPAPLRVGYILWPGCFPMAIAQQKGFFDRQGVKIEPVYSPNYLTGVSDFSAGKYDGTITTFGGIMSMIEKDPDIQIILVSDYSDGADVVVAQHNIQKVAELKGKRIGVKLGEFGELLVLKMLEKNNLTSDKVTLVDVEAETVPQRLKGGDIQAGQTWYLYASQAIKAGANVLFTSKQTPGLIPDMFVFRGQVLRDRSKEVEAFIRGWFEAVNYWKTHPQESKALIAKGFKIEPEEVKIDGVQVLDLQGNLKAFTPGSSTESLYYTAKLYADFSIQRGALATRPDIQKLINPSFVRQLLQKN